MNGVAVARAIAQRFREARSKNVEKMQHIFFAHRIVAQKPDGLIALLGGRRISRGAFVDAKEHVVEHPLGLQFVVRVAAHDLPAHFPRAAHVLNQIIVPFGWSLRVRAESYESDEDSNEN